MDATSWTAPPGAAQPTGIQSTAGAVPIMNENLCVPIFNVQK